MGQLPTNRTTANTPAEHVADHDELHRLHDLLDPITPYFLGGQPDVNLNDAASLHTIASQALTIAVGDVVTFEAEVIVLNNSGGTKTYTAAISLAGADESVAAAATVAASASNRVPYWIRGGCHVKATNDVRWWLAFNGNVAGAAGAAISEGNVNNNRFLWDNTATDLTGSAKTAAIKFQSSAIGGTAQTLWVPHASIHHQHASV